MGGQHSGGGIDARVGTVGHVEKSDFFEKSDF